MQSKITLSADKEGDITRLKDSYYNAPYKLVHYGNKVFHNHLELIVMCSSPGVMDGDTLEMDVQINEQAEVKLFTQSFNKLHPMKKGASQNLRIQIKQGAIFQYVPHPITPFEDSIFHTVNQIKLESDSTLIFGDIYTSGRVHSGESFKFKKVHSQTEIRREQRLIYKDNLLMEPQKQPISKSVFWDGKTHHATLIYISPAANAIKEELDEILTEENINGMDFGFSQFADNGILIRALSESGEKLYNWLKILSDMCWQFTVHFQDEKLEKLNDKIELPKTISVEKVKSSRKKESAPKRKLTSTKK